MTCVLVFIFVLFAVISAQPEHGATRIIGGTETTIQNYPFAAVILATNDLVIFRQQCGGSVLNSRSIMTAAHCINPRVPNQYRVRLGSSFASSGGQVYNIARAIIHPEYNLYFAFDNDIALIQTTTTIIYIPTLVAQGSIAGPNYILPDDTAVVAIGWGLTSQGIGASTSEQLRHVEVFKLSREVCRQRWGRSFTDNMICSGVLDVGGKGQCGNDSGGPVVHNDVIIGISSFVDSQNCVSGVRPNVSVRVSRFTAWIQANA